MRGREAHLNNLRYTMLRKKELMWIYQEIIVDTTMFKVMSNGRPEDAVHLQHAHGIVLSDTSVRQHHVSHLQHGRHMHTAAKTLTLQWLKWELKGWGGGP